MLKKMTLLAMAVAALAAFAVPAIASAAPALTSPPGTLIVPPATITATSINAETTNTPLGTLKCEHVLVPVELTKNNGTVVEGKSGGVGTTRNCTSSNPVGPVTITDPTATAFNATTPGKGTVSLAFTASPCTYTGTVPFTYVAGSDSIHVAGAINSPLCGSAEFHGDFTLTVDPGGAAVTLD